MAALDSTKFVSFTLPPSNLPFYNNNTFWPPKSCRSIRSLNTSSSQKIHRPATIFSQSGCRAEAYGNTTARAEGYKLASANNHNKTDDDLPSFKELFQTALPPNTSTKASKAEHTLQHLKQPACDAAGTLVDQTKSGLGERQGDSLDQPMTLDNESDEAGAEGKVEGLFGDVDTGRIEWDASLHNTSAISERASAPTKSIDASGLWYDIEEGCYIEEPAPGLGSREQYGVPSTPAQAQPQTLPQSSTPLQDQINQQDIDDITQGMSVESAPHSLPKPSDSGDDGWTNDSMAEFEKELGLALEEQVKSSSASALTSSSPRSVEAPQDEIQIRECTDTTGSRLEELQDTSRHGTAQGLEEWEQPETEVVVETLGRRELGAEELAGEAGRVEMQQHEEIAGQKEELRRPALGDQQNLAEVDDTDVPMDKEATEALPATQLEIDHHHFRLRGIRTQQLPERQTKTTQYRVVWGEHPNRSDSWVNEDDMRMSMLRPPCERSSQDLVPPVERDVMRVHRMRYNRSSKGKKIFEYLVDKSRTWITEDQLRISLSPMLVAELKASSPYPLSRPQSEVYLKHPATPINDGHRHTSRASRSPSASIGLALSSELERGKWGEKRRHQDTTKEISSDVHNSEDSDRSHETNNEDVEDDEDPRPAKRRKLPPTPTDNALTPPGEPTLVDNDHHHTPRTSRSPSIMMVSAPVVEYREWPFQGFLKRTKIGNETTYNLEFQLSHIPEHLYIPVLSEALGMRSNKEMSAEAATPHDTGAHSRVHSAALQSKRKRVSWKPEENETILKMKKEGCS